MPDPRFLIIAEGAFGPETSKTANSAVRYLPERVVGVLDSKASGRTCQEVLHGSCPKGMILCHQSSRQFIGDYSGRTPWLRIPPLSELVRLHEYAAAPVQPSKVLGIALNTYDLSHAEAEAAVARAAAETGLPATDPVRFDPAPLVDAIAAFARSRPPA